MEALPKIVKQRLQASTKPGAHPQADLLTAFAEKRLSEPERVQVLEHLAQCEGCREVMFFSAAQEAPAQVVGKITSNAGWLSWPMLRWGAAAACVVVVGTAITLRHQSQNHPALSDRALSEKKTENTAPYAAPEPAVATTANANRPVELRDKVEQARKDERKELVAKLEPPPPRPSPKAMTATPQFQFDQAQPANGNVVGGGVGGGMGSGGAAVGSNMAAPSDSGGLARGVNPQAESDQKRSYAAVSPETVKVQSQSEVVEVEASPSPVVGHANESVTVTGTAPADLPVNGREVSSLQKLTSPAAASVAMKQDAANSEKKEKTLDHASTKNAPRWMVNSDGLLQRSWDEGKTWETVPISSKDPFKTFSAVGAEVWVGGDHGALFHSSDTGQHWLRVRPRSIGVYLNAGITHIEFSDAQNGKITTAKGETWTTFDGGQTWEKD